MAKDRLVYRRADGGISVVVPGKGFTLEDCKKRGIPEDATELMEIDSADIPLDRHFRNGWDLKEGKVVHCMDKCKALRMEELKKVREENFKKLDIEYQRADEDGDAVKKADVAAKKKLLRDMPASFDMSALSLEELKTAKPDYLEGDIVRDA